jgi:hypothetical protein
MSIISVGKGSVTMASCVACRNDDHFSSIECRNYDNFSLRRFSSYSHFSSLGYCNYDNFNFQGFRNDQFSNLGCRVDDQMSSLRCCSYNTYITSVSSSYSKYCFKLRNRVVLAASSESPYSKASYQIILITNMGVGVYSLSVYVVCLKCSVNGTRKQTKQNIQTN